MLQVKLKQETHHRGSVIKVIPSKTLAIGVVESPEELVDS